MEYYFIDLKLNWFDAQQFCRENYTDLATVSSMEDLVRLEIPSDYSAWIGMFDDPASWNGVLGNGSNLWRWSRTGTTSPGGYQNWAPGEPSNSGTFHFCVSVAKGQWWDDPCAKSYAFVCFTDSTQLDKKQYSLVTTAMSWKNAQSYCRKYYTDLATIEDETENTAVTKAGLGHQVWIGLYRDPWMWSDGSTSTFTNWPVGQPDFPSLEPHCVKVNKGMNFLDTYCAEMFAFFCEKAVKKKRIHVVKMELQADVDLSDSSISTLKQTNTAVHRISA
ncbi:hypothetical protein WMY93_027030 [Mugilogobius chulae]|uniref:C-type lectin domain-containing protein n=1 Tax=Mugilogobius chulae TaxID=88201 RepID=A0AAW0MXR6_9GOBI